MLAVVGVRAMEGRVGSTLVVRWLATAPGVVVDRRYPFGEYRYLSWCVRAASALTEPFDPERHPGPTPMFFGDDRPFGPLPFAPSSLDLDDLRGRLAAHLWSAVSESMRCRDAGARVYVEKLGVPVDAVTTAGIPLEVVDLVRDPRDVLASIRAFTARTGHDGFGRRPGEREADYLPRFIANVARQLDAMSSSPVERLLLRYEDLVADPAGAAAALGAWLDLALDLGAVDVDEAHATSASPAASVGRWRADLDPGEAEAVWSALEDRLRPLGYEP